MKVVALVLQKGGSGKTTIAVHLAVCAEPAKKTSAIIDLDPQASAVEWPIPTPLMPGIAVRSMNRAVRPPKRFGHFTNGLLRTGRAMGEHLHLWRRFGPGIFLVIYELNKYIVRNKSLYFRL